MPNLNTPPTEAPDSFTLEIFRGTVVLRRRFQAFGTLAEVFERQGANSVLPREGDPLPAQAPLDPRPGSDLGFVNQLGGLLSDGSTLNRQWIDRFHVSHIRIATNPSERSTHSVEVDYSTEAPADPYAPVVTIRVGTETLLMKWDWNGNPITPGFDGSIPVEVPIAFLSYTVPMRRFNDLYDEISAGVGKTNSEHWTLITSGSPLPKVDNTQQWVFMGADATKNGELNWRATFRFTWFPPIDIQNFFVGEDQGGPLTDVVTAPERGRYFYWFVERADGSINQEAQGENNDPRDGSHGLQRVVVREAFDFNMFFTGRGVDSGRVR